MADSIQNYLSVLKILKERLVNETQRLILYLKPRK